MKLTREFLSIDRYYFDFNVCTPSKGFAQVDTPQDAWYYGHWFNPFTLTLVAYIEGDVVTTQYESKDECITDMRYLSEWNVQHNGKSAKIDGMCNQSLIETIKELGLGDMLH